MGAGLALTVARDAVDTAGAGIGHRFVAADLLGVSIRSSPGSAAFSIVMLHFAGDEFVTVAGRSRNRSARGDVLGGLGRSGEA